MTRPALVCVLLLAVVASRAQTSSRMPTMEAVRFGDLEKRLAQAQQRGDLAALRALVADDFELRDAANSSELTLRDEWLDSAARGGQACPVRELMPRLFDDTAVISFVCRAGEQHHFVVDVWRKHASEWKLAARYVSPAPPPAADVKTKQ